MTVQPSTPPTPLRIVMVSMHTSPADAPGRGDAGGMNVVECHAALALAASGHQVEIVTRRCADDQPDAVTLAPGVTLHHLTAGPQRRLAKSATDQYVPEFSQALADLGERLADDGTPVDLVHSHHWMSGMAALPLARAWGVPHVQSFHSVAATPGAGLSDGEPPESPARVPGEALLARESDLLVAISAAEARTVVERCGADPDRVSIVPPGVDLDLFHPLGRPEGTDRVGGPPGWEAPVPGLALDRPFAVVAARLQPLKAPDLAIAALAHVPEELRPALVVAGAGSADFADYEAHLRRLADELGLHDGVHLVGPQSRTDLAWLLRHATLTLVPSHSETFGLVALESAASGTPVVAAATGGLREAVVHGETGQLMDSRRPEDWGEAITRLLDRPDVLHRMGTVARVHARRFTWAATVSGLLHVYGGLLDRTAGSRRYLFVHAHPDDETLSSGAAILALRRRGDEPMVVTATRGERGEVTETVAEQIADQAAARGSASSGRGPDDDLVAWRLAERAQALAHLGAVDAGFLGADGNRAPGHPDRRYPDSGMAWVTPTTAGPAPDAPADAFSRAALAEVVADVVAAARRWHADVLVSYDATGGYGHPDHVRCHDATALAAAELGIGFQQIAPTGTPPSAPAGGGGDGEVLDAGPDLDRLVAAHRAYASQLTVEPGGATYTHVGGQGGTVAVQTHLTCADDQHQVAGRTDGSGGTVSTGSASTPRACRTPRRRNVTRAASRRPAP